MSNLLNKHEASAAIGVTWKALEKWRRQGTGPRFIRISKTCVRYDPADIREFIDKRREGPTESIA